MKTMTAKYAGKFSTYAEYNGVNMTLVGQWADLAAYYRGDDGSAWCYNHCVGRWSACGDYQSFVAQFAGKHRGQLFEPQAA